MILHVLSQRTTFSATGWQPLARVIVLPRMQHPFDPDFVLQCPKPATPGGRRTLLPLRWQTERKTDEHVSKSN